MTHDGEMIRELRFTINADGTVKQPKCIGETVRPAGQQYLLDVTVKRGLDPKYDKKAFGKRAWFGVGASACK
ncbi:MAG: hypothetical protein ACI9MR_000410 [Myxococcota bacterium]